MKVLFLSILGLWVVYVVVKKAYANEEYYLYVPLIVVFIGIPSIIGLIYWALQ